MLVRSGLFTEHSNKNHVCQEVSGTKRQVYVAMDGQTDMTTSVPRLMLSQILLIYMTDSDMSPKAQSNYLGKMSVPSVII